jgi:hypothetical protein
MLRIMLQRFIVTRVKKILQIEVQDKYWGLFTLSQIIYLNFISLTN